MAQGGAVNDGMHGGVRLMGFPMARTSALVLFPILGYVGSTDAQAPRASGVGTKAEVRGNALAVDRSASRVYIKVGAEGYGHVHGVEGRLASGEITPGGAGELVFDMTSFSADTPTARSYL